MRRPATIALALLLCGAAASQTPTVHVAGDQRPPVLDLLDRPGEDLLDLSISPDGNRAVAALDAADKPPRSQLRLFEVGRGLAGTVDVKGRVRDLLFSRDGATVYVLQHFPRKKREGDTFLLTLDWDAARTTRSLRVPDSAKGLDHWAASDALLVAARNEIRTIFLPELRSGPLFRITGENSAVASMGGDLVLVGQDDGLVLVDLGVPSGREAMPLADRAATPSAVVSLAAEPAAASAIARLADGTVVPVELGPLRVGGAPAPRVAETPPEPEPVAEVPQQPVAPPREPPKATPPAPEPEPVAEIPPQPAPPSQPLKAEPEQPPELPRREAPKAPPVQAPPRGQDQPPPEPLPTPTDHRPQIRGTIEGPRAGEVSSVVLFGPNNILREAARVKPANNRWEVDGLAPGRYRVELSGGGSAVLVTEPRFLLLTVAPGEPVVAPVFKVVGAL